MTRSMMLIPALFKRGFFLPNAQTLKQDQEKFVSSWLFRQKISQKTSAHSSVLYSKPAKVLSNSQIYLQKNIVQQDQKSI